MLEALQHILFKATSNLIGVHVSISGFLNQRKWKFKHPIRKVWYIEEHVLDVVVPSEKQINCFVFLPTDLNKNARSSHQVAIHKECCLDIRANLDSLIILARMNQSHGLRHIGFAVQWRMVLPFCNISQHLMAILQSQRQELCSCLSQIDFFVEPLVHHKRQTTNMIHMIMRNQAEIDVSRDERQTLIVLAVLPLLEETTINNKFDRAIIWLFYNNQIA